MILPALFALACLAVSPGSDQILVRDLAPSFPSLASAAGDAPVALAPAPGVARVFRTAELRALAVRLNLPAPPPDQPEICVTRPVAAPDPARLLAAMRKEMPEATIEILEFSRQPIPEGEIEFPARQLRRGAGGALWLGYVHYGGNHRFTIWAKVKVLVTVERVLAVGDLASGQPIQAAQLTAQTLQEYPSSEPFARSIDEVAGKWPRLPIRAGMAIRTDLLENPRDIVRGDTVRVEVRNGAAHLELEATAEASGAFGEIIPVLNPISKKRFPARVEGKGRVSVDAAAAEVIP
jgi:flagella basal body P-ring formation protein FlgA